MRLDKRELMQIKPGKDESFMNLFIRVALAVIPIIFFMFGSFSKIIFGVSLCS